MTPIDPGDWWRHQQCKFLCSLCCGQQVRSTNLTCIAISNFNYYRTFHFFATSRIPLNDEFLKAFGKREKEYDEVSGRVMDIDKTSLDIIDVSDDENETDNKPKSQDAKKTDFSELKKCKVKISNMSYKTTSATIARTCGAFGPMLDVNLILDGNGQSSGRAYVVFEDHETAMSCAEKMNQKSLEGRTLYVSLASKSGRKSFDPSKKQDNRYWERDISTKVSSPNRDYEFM